MQGNQSWVMFLRFKVRQHLSYWRVIRWIRTRDLRVGIKYSLTTQIILGSFFLVVRSCNIHQECGREEFLFHFAIKRAPITLFQNCCFDCYLNSSYYLIQHILINPLLIIRLCSFTEELSDFSITEEYPVQIHMTIDSYRCL